MFLVYFMFSILILILVVVAVVMGNVAYFTTQQAMGKDADEE